MKNKAYTRSSWHGIPTYQCTLCPFDCMSEEEALAHYASHFEAPEEDYETEEVSLVVDGSGRIERITARVQGSSAPAEPDFLSVLGTGHIE